jgi:hypothetical protein
MFDRMLSSLSWMHRDWYLAATTTIMVVVVMVPGVAEVILTLMPLPVVPQAHPSNLPEEANKDQDQDQTTNQRKRQHLRTRDHLH